jgi:cytochrome c oxidase assembly factor CtaG
VEIELTEPPVAASPHPGRSSRWLAPAGIALIVACLVPPVSVLARRYLFVESVQFCVFAMVGPALIVLGAPWRLVGMSRLAGRLAVARRHRTSFASALGHLIAWIGICLVWRLPPVLDGLARHDALIAAEAVTLGAAGIGLWLELVPSPPLAPRLARPQRALIAALAMWFVWAAAYILGFAGHAVVDAYDAAGSHLTTVADQEITAFLLWAVPAACFIPVIFVAAVTWLKDDAGPAGDGLSTGVRGWGRPAPGARRRRGG